LTGNSGSNGQTEFGPRYGYCGFTLGSPVGLGPLERG
jgi:hypothetical protein